MDRIGALPDDLLVKILSSLPTTKAAVSTCILSKRWQFLWMWLPKLKYFDTCYSTSEYEMLVHFLNKKLPLHRAPVIESFRLDLDGRPANQEDLKKWVVFALSRGVRKLGIRHYSEYETVFPINVYTCKSLLVLRTSGVNLTDIPPMAHLPTLKTLRIRNSSFTEESFQRLLSICPILEDLTVELHDSRLNIKRFSIIVPTLQRLSLRLSSIWALDGYVIDTPSVTYFKLEDYGYYRQYPLIKDMSKLLQAYADIDDFHVHNSLTESITSVRSLTICPQSAYGSFVFNNLQHLKLCVCRPDSLHEIAQFLQNSPNLRVLDICASTIERHFCDEPPYEDDWSQPNTVPGCLLSSLQTLKWSRYFGTPLEIDIVVYILQNACHLKKATVILEGGEGCETEHIVDNELIFPAQTTCQLILVGDVM